MILEGEREWMIINSNIINFVKEKNKLGEPDNNDLFKRV